MIKRFVLFDFAWGESALQGVLTPLEWEGTWRMQ